MFKLMFPQSTLPKTEPTEKIILFMLLALNRLLPEGLAKVKMRYFNPSKKGDIWMLISDLFHSIIVDGKKRILTEFILESTLWNDIALI